MIMKRFLLLIIIIIFFACAKHQVKPVPQPIDDKSLPKLSIINIIAIEPLANQPTKRFDLCSAGAQSYRVTSDDLTNAAVEVAREVLRSNDVKIVNNSNKKIWLSAINSNCRLEKRAYRHEITLRILAGDSIKKDFSGYRSVGHVFSTRFAIEMAINQAVLEMFGDRQIIDYLQN